MRRLSLSSIRFWSVLTFLFAFGWWWVTRTHSGSWWWAALWALVPPLLFLPLPLWLAWGAGRARKRGWLLLNLGVAAAFTVLVCGFVLPRPRSTPAGLPLTVLTLNTHFASADPAGIAELAVRENAQVVLLQETLDHARVAGPYEARLRAAFPDWTLVRHDELITLARLPLLRRDIVAFPNSPHAVLLTEVRLEGQKVTVVNVHLPHLSLKPVPSGRNLRERIEGDLKLRRDFEVLVADVQRGSSGPLLIGGDFNAPPSGGLAWQMEHLGFDDTFRRGGVGFGHTFHALLGFSRLDYLWLQGAEVEQGRALPSLLSDHRPLLVRLRLPTTSSEQP